MNDEKRTPEQLYRLYDTAAYNLATVCQQCGLSWARHIGLACPRINGKTFVPLEPSPTPTLDKMEAEAIDPRFAAAHYMDGRDLKAPTPDAVEHYGLIDERSPQGQAQLAAISTALPPIAGLTRNPDLQHTSHQVAHQHGSAYLVR